MELDGIYILAGACILDTILGDPSWIPHLIVGYGKLIRWGEKLLNRGNQRFLLGMFMTLVLVSISYIIPYYTLEYASQYHPYLHIALSTVILFYCIANKTLIKEGLAVFDVLKQDGLEAGRRQLSRIVGRDTSALDEHQIRTATLETMAENLSDGVIAPLFYFALLGPAGAMMYKMINTLDSMIGYKSDRFEQFGKFAARLDDVANYIPARLTALLILASSFRWSGLTFVFRQGKNHSSPNAGYPEAAMAYLLSCKFGGPNTYHGKYIDKPYIGTNERVILHEDIHKAIRINYATFLCFVTLIIICNVLISL